MSVTLIADCGSTKIDWCVVRDGVQAQRFETTGMNAVMLTREEMEKKIAEEAAPQLPAGIERIYFYGAGCISPQVCENVAKALEANVPGAKAEVYTDLLGAARALCGRAAGIACIMGTGSNACYYDGEKIADGVSPLGYILGDEGSGAVLGKLLVGNVLKRQLPEDLCEKFLEQYQLDNLAIIERVYRQPGANRFLASLSPFLLQNIDRQEIYDMTYDAFASFFTRNVRQLAKRHGTAQVNMIGSIAHYYADVLRSAAMGCGVKVDKIVKSPMEGLVAYHSANS